MSRIVRSLVLALIVALVACATLTHSGGLVLFAQSLPTVKHVVWTPSVVDATHSAPTQYKVTVDGGTPVILAASACAATCTQAITLTSFGAHTVVIVAENPSLSTDPTSLQDSPPISVPFALNFGPGTVTGSTVTQ